MKLFHTENGKEAVYVQMQDIMYLANETDVPIPATIFEKVFTGVTIVTDSNRFDFIRFEETHEVEFFRNLEFIINFDQYKDFSDKQLEEEVQKFGTKANEIAEMWNSMTTEERKKNFLAEIYAMKHGKRTMLFPEFVELPKEQKKKQFLF